MGGLHLGRGRRSLPASTWTPTPAAALPLLALALLHSARIAAADPGLTRKVYYGLGTTPNFPISAATTPSMADVAPTVDCPPAAACFPAANTHVVYSGYVLLPSAAVEIGVYSNGYAQLYLDGGVVISHTSGGPSRPPGLGFSRWLAAPAPAWDVQQRSLPRDIT